MINGRPALLELFCGTKSIGKEFANKGFEVVSVDFDKQFNATITADILDLNPRDFAHIGFDCIWASPPCNAFSVAVIGRNWTHDHKPKTEVARTGLAILEKAVDFIQTLTVVNPNILWWMENPRGKMRRMPILSGFHRETVTYCQYGDSRMKPTDIWTNTQWIPRPVCARKSSCHESAPRGSKTGTLALKGSVARSVIPSELCKEIADYASEEINSRGSSEVRWEENESKNKQ